MRVHSIVVVAVALLSIALVAANTESASAAVPPPAGPPCAGMVAWRGASSPAISLLACYEPDPASLRPLSNSQINQLKKAGFGPEEEKVELGFTRTGPVDLKYDPASRGVFAQVKAGGEPEYTGVKFGPNGPEVAPLPDVPDVPEVPEVIE